MYATGIGLVVKGFQSTFKSLENNTIINSENQTSTIKNHSTKTKGGFFDKILSKSRTWFEEED